MENEGFKKIDFNDLPECFIIWCKNIKFFQKEKLKVYKKLRSSTKQDEVFRIIITTKTNTYTIIMNIDKDYLGCTAQRKEPLSGEDWLRGRDLPDGKLNKFKFDDILSSIVFYEAEKINYEKFKLFDLINDLKKGYIITREEWNFKCFLYYNSENLPIIFGRNQKPYYWMPNIEELEAEDWVNIHFFYTGPQSIIQVLGYYGL